MKKEYSNYYFSTPTLKKNLLTCVDVLKNNTNTYKFSFKRTKLLNCLCIMTIISRNKKSRSVKASRLPYNVLPLSINAYCFGLRINSCSQLKFADLKAFGFFPSILFLFLFVYLAIQKNFKVCFGQKNHKLKILHCVPLKYEKREYVLCSFSSFL